MGNPRGWSQHALEGVGMIMLLLALAFLTVVSANPLVIKQMEDNDQRLVKVDCHGDSRQNQPMLTLDLFYH